MDSKKSSEIIPPAEGIDLSYLDAKTTVTNINPYQRRGFKCRHCGSQIELLFVEGKKIYLVCAGCDTDKGESPFEAGLLVMKGAGIPQK